MTTTCAQTSKIESFEQIEILYPNNNKVSVKIIFLDDSVQIVNKKDGTTLKTFKYTDIKSAEYSYTRSPRWREGLAMGAAGILFPPLWLVALPMGFTKTQHHWLTFQSENDYIVFFKSIKESNGFSSPLLKLIPGLKLRRWVIANNQSL